MARPRTVFTVSRIIHFCYGHRLYGYGGKCRHLHGHNAAAELSFRCRGLDRLGMALDFDEIKSVVQTWVDAELDHRLLLNKRDPLVKVLRDLGEPVVALPGNPTAENIAKLLFESAAGRKLPVSRVRVWESRNTWAEFSR